MALNRVALVDLQQVSIDALSDVNTSSSAPTSGQVLAWSGSAWVPVTLASPALLLDQLSDVDTSTTAPTTGQALAWNGTTWAPATISSASRLSLTYSGSLAANASADFTLTAGRSGLLLSALATYPAWVRLYSTAAARTADVASGRTISTDPATGSGLVAEFILVANTLAAATPSVAYLNLDSPSTANLYGRITNLDTTTRTVDLTVQVTRLEA